MENNQKGEQLEKERKIVIVNKKQSFFTWLLYLIEYLKFLGEITRVTSQRPRVQNSKENFKLYLFVLFIYLNLTPQRGEKYRNFIYNVFADTTGPGTIPINCNRKIIKNCFIIIIIFPTIINGRTYLVLMPFDTELFS